MPIILQSQTTRTVTYIFRRVAEHHSLSTASKRLSSRFRRARFAAAVNQYLRDTVHSRHYTKNVKRKEEEEKGDEHSSNCMPLNILHLPNGPVGLVVRPPRSVLGARTDVWVGIAPRAGFDVEVVFAVEVVLAALLYEIVCEVEKGGGDGVVVIVIVRVVTTDIVVVVVVVVMVMVMIVV